MDRPAKLVILEEELRERGFEIKRDDWSKHIVVTVKERMYSIYYGGKYFEIMRLTRSGQPDSNFSERNGETYQGMLSLVMGLK